jgi:hypothetical protein
MAKCCFVKRSRDRTLILRFNTFDVYGSVVMDPGQTRSVNKVKSMGQKVKVNGQAVAWDTSRAHIW